MSSWLSYVSWKRYLLQKLYNVYHSTMFLKMYWDDYFYESDNDACDSKKHKGVLVEQLFLTYDGKVINITSPELIEKLLTGNCYWSDILHSIDQAGIAQNDGREYVLEIRYLYSKENYRVCYSYQNGRSNNSNESEGNEEVKEKMDEDIIRFCNLDSHKINFPPYTSEQLENLEELDTSFMNGVLIANWNPSNNPMTEIMTEYAGPYRNFYNDIKFKFSPKWIINKTEKNAYLFERGLFFKNFVGTEDVDGNSVELTENEIDSRISIQLFDMFGNEVTFGSHAPTITIEEVDIEALVPISTQIGSEEITKSLMIYKEENRFDWWKFICRLVGY